METTTEKILVTGALGQIGTELTSKLVEIHGKENVIASGIEKWREGNTAAGWYERIDVTNYKFGFFALRNFRETTAFCLET
jgi:nucleoside-triphosphatase THEP1